MRPSRSTAEDTEDGLWALTATQMREAAAIFDDSAYDDRDLFALQDAAIRAVESVLGAPARVKRVVDSYATPGDGRLELSARPFGAAPLGASQFASLQVVASTSSGEATLDASLDLSGDAPAVVPSEAVPQLFEAVALPLRCQYLFDPGPLPQHVVEAVAVAFQGVFDSRYRGAPPLPLDRIEDALAGDAELLGPYD